MFGLGVESSEPGPDGFVLRTMLRPAPPGGAEVRWEVAADPRFRLPVAHGTVRSDGPVVRVPVHGLEAGREYWYRFRCGRVMSADGRAVTLPRPRSHPGRLRLAVASGDGGGDPTAYRELAAQQPDAVVVVGPPPPPMEAGYADLGLQEARAAAPWIQARDGHPLTADFGRLVRVHLGPGGFDGPDGPELSVGPSERTEPGAAADSPARWNLFDAGDPAGTGRVRNPVVLTSGPHWELLSAHGGYLLLDVRRWSIDVHLRSADTSFRIPRGRGRLPRTRQTSRGGAVSVLTQAR